jgi:hypothetical protein
LTFQQTARGYIPERRTLRNDRCENLESYMSEELDLTLRFIFFGRDWVHLVRRPLIDLLYQPRMMSVEQSVEWELAGETEALVENLPLCLPQIAHHMTGLELGPPR